MQQPSKANATGTWACNGDFIWACLSNGKDRKQARYVRRASWRSVFCLPVTWYIGKPCRFPHVDTFNRDVTAVVGSQSTFAFSAADPDVQQADHESDEQTLLTKFISCSCVNCRSTGLKCAHASEFGGWDAVSMQMCRQPGQHCTRQSLNNPPCQICKRVGEANPPRTGFRCKFHVSSRDSSHISHLSHSLVYTYTHTQMTNGEGSQ